MMQITLDSQDAKNCDDQSMQVSTAAVETLSGNPAPVTTSKLEAPPAAPKLRPQPSLDLPGQMDMGILPHSTSASDFQSRSNSNTMRMASNPAPYQNPHSSAFNQPAPRFGQPNAISNNVTPHNLLMPGLTDTSMRPRDRLEMSQRLTQILAILTDKLSQELASHQSNISHQSTQRSENEPQLERNGHVCKNIRPMNRESDQSN